MGTEGKARLAPIAIRRDHLSEHPAVLAWSELRPVRVEPERLDILQERGSKCIYRLHGIGIAGAPVIAKRCRTSSAAVERNIYQDVLPHVPVSAPQFYGWSANDEEFGWLFLEDVGQERYSTLNEEHRALAGRWLGRMHSFTARHGVVGGAPQGLPDGGPGRYLQHLRAARWDLLENLSNPGLTPEDTAMLQATARLQDRLETTWSRVEGWCREMPPTLVHGDFRPKNGYLRSTAEGLDLLPIDWEMAGWGVPAVDLPELDLVAYQAAARVEWPHLELPLLDRLARVGQVFRLLAAIGWQSSQFKYTARQYLAKPLTDLRIFSERLSRCIHAAEL